MTEQDYADPTRPTWHDMSAADRALATALWGLAAFGLLSLLLVMTGVVPLVPVG